MPCTVLQMLPFNHKPNLKVKQHSPCFDAKVGKLKKTAKTGFAYVLTEVWMPLRLDSGAGTLDSDTTFSSGLRESFMAPPLCVDIEEEIWKAGTKTYLDVPFKQLFNFVSTLGSQDFL